MFSPVKALKERWKRRRLIKELKRRVQKLVDRGDSCVTSAQDEDCRYDYYLDLGPKAGVTLIGGMFRVIHDGEGLIEVNDEIRFIDMQRVNYVLQLLRQKMILDDLADV